MCRITLDAETLHKLLATLQSVEVCDESGEVVGVFQPRLDPAKYDLEPKISEEELRRRMNDPRPGRTWAEIRKDLERTP
jgi:hypothetical protein